MINYTEFLAAALETKGMIEEYRLAEAFDLLDCDDSGYSKYPTLIDLLPYLCFVISHPLVFASFKREPTADLGREHGREVH